MGKFSALCLSGFSVHQIRLHLTVNPAPFCNQETGNNILPASQHKLGRRCHIVSARIQLSATRWIHPSYRLTARNSRSSTWSRKNPDASLTNASPGGMLADGCGVTASNWNSSLTIEFCFYHVWWFFEPCITSRFTKGKLSLDVIRSVTIR